MIEKNIAINFGMNAITAFGLSEKRGFVLPDDVKEKIGNVILDALREEQKA